MSKDAREIAKALEYLKYAPLKEGVIKRVLTVGAEPMRAELQQLYISADKTGMGGRLGIYIDIQPARRRLDTVYIGPAKKISKGWQLWYLFNYGHVAKSKNGTTGKVVAGKRLMDSAVAHTKQKTIELVGVEFEKEMAKLAKRLGFEVKNY